jgi:hypothetical protein
MIFIYANLQIIFLALSLSTFSDYLNESISIKLSAYEFIFNLRLKILMFSIEAVLWLGLVI